MRAVFITDPHVKADPRENEILAERLAPLDPADLLIVSGDVTDNGSRDEYNEARRLLAPWKGHCILAPGNHDCAGLHGLRWSDQAAARWAKFTQDMEALSDSVVNGVYICALDSVNAEPNLAELAQGELGEAELERAREAIEQAHLKGLKVCLTMHHNPVDNPRSGASSPIEDAEDKFLDWAEKLRDSEKFLKIAYGQADYIVCGHTHLRLSWTSTRGIPTQLLALGDFRGQGDTFTL